MLLFKSGCMLESINIFLVFFSIVSLQIFCQTKSISESKVYSLIDKNAQNLLRNSGATSVSVGIVKNGKIYTKHYGEIDRGKGKTGFQSTFPRGERLGGLCFLYAGYQFQSTFPRGERLKVILDDETLTDISIHVPAWGTTK